MCQVAKKVIPGNSEDSIYDIMRRCALSEEDEFELKKYVENLGMVFLSTPFSRAAADRLEKFGVAAYKIGSGELNNYPLISHVAEFGKPMIVSTGMNDLASVSKAVDILEKHGVDYALMHTTNLYPTKPEWVRLGAMQEMMKEFSHVPIGLSDHTRNNNACIAAMALGADLVERHFTDRMDRTGPDIVCSMDEKVCAELIQASKEIPQMRGGHKKALTEEQVTIDFAFATAVTIKPIKEGEIFTKENLWVKRPGTGEIPAERLSELLGKKAAVDIERDVQLTWEMVH
jgi:N-acetylneuraminate synthase/UDP-N-acetylglucosamine 2-epimerase (hydrolysing)